MRGLIIIFTTIILLCITCYYLWQKGIPQGLAKCKIITEVEKILNGKVKIKGLHFKFPNQVILEEIKLSLNSENLPVLEIKKILCNYNLIPLIIGRLEPGISKIAVIEPHVYLYRDKGGNWNFASLFKPQIKPQKKKPPAIAILIKKARLKVKDEIFGTQTTLSKIYASYYPQGSPPHFYIRIGQEIKIRGNIYNIYPLQTNFNLKIIKKDISDYAGFLKTSWAHLLHGQVSGNLEGRIQNKEISLEAGNLSINKGAVKLTQITSPVTNIIANFSLTPNYNLIADKLKFKFRNIDITTQRFYIKDIYKKEALIEFVTSEFYLKELGDIFPYLNKLNLKSVLKFKGGIDFSHSFGLFGEVELFNQTDTGYKFPILAKIKYKDKAFDNISLSIDKKTQIEGKLDVGKKLFDLNAKFDKSNLIPLLALSGKELKKGTVTGEIMAISELKSLKYEGNLKLEIDDNNLLFKEITAKVKGDKKSIAFTSQLVQPKGKIEIQGKGIREDINQPFSFSLTSTLNKCNLFNRDISSNIIFNGNLTTRTKLIGGEIKAENIIIDNNSYFNWQGNLLYDYPTLNILISHGNQQLNLCAKIPFAQPIITSMQIKTQNINLSMLTKEINGTFDGEFNLEKLSKTKFTISGKSVRVNLANGRKLNGNFELTKTKDKIYIEHLILNEPNISIEGGFDLTSPQATLDLKMRVYQLKYKDFALNTYAEFKGYFSNSQLAGLINFTDGKFNDFGIDHGEVNFIYANQNFAIKESSIVLDNGGILTILGTLTTKGKVNLKFSLIGMDYQDMPYQYFKRFKGKFDFIGEINGDIDNPIISASLKSNEVTVAHQRIAKISGRIKYFNNEVQIIDSRVNDKLGFQGTFQTKDEYLTGIIQLAGEKLTTLASLLSLPSKNLQGIIKGQIKTNGKLDNLPLKGEVEIEDFHIPGFEATYGEAKFTLENKILSFQKFYFIQGEKRKIEFKKYQLEIKPDGKVNLIVNMENFIIANVRFDGEVYFTGIGTPLSKAKGTLNVKDLLINQSDEFKKLAVGISYEDGLLEFLPVSDLNSLSGKVRFISNEKLEIKDIKILKSNVEKLKINGTVELLEKRCDLRFVMENSDLTILPLWFRGIKTPEGKVNGWLHICGDFDDPQFNATLMVTNGALTTFPFAKRVTNLQGEICIINNWFVSNFLSAKIGKSTLVIKSNTPFTLKNVDITLKSSNEPLPLSIPGFLEGDVEVDIQIKGNITAPIGSGNIKIVNARFTYPFKIEIPSGTKSKIQWENLMITVGKNVKYYNEYVDVKIKEKDSWIKISGKQDEILAEGTVYGCTNGKVNYLGKNFTIKRAYLEFREPHLPPYLSGYATAQLGKRRIVLIYEGYIEEETKPILQALGGYPPMNEEQIINALLSGKTEDTTIDSEAILKAGFTQVVGKEIAFSLLTPIEKQISQMLRIDVELKTSALERLFQESFKNEDIKEERITKSIFADSEVRIGRFITDDLYVIYRGRLRPWEEEEFARLKLKQELELEYYISGNTSLKYKFVPQGVWRKGNEYEVMIERQVRF